MLAHEASHLVLPSRAVSRSLYGAAGPGEQAFEIHVKLKPKAVPGRLTNGTKLTAIK
jgi:hypothetical protein